MTRAMVEDRARRVLKRDERGHEVDALVVESLEIDA